MVQLTEQVRNAPAAVRGERPVTTWRQDVITMVLATWPITALYFDARGHNNDFGQESFWSTAHLFLYVGASVFAGWIAWIIVNEQLAAGVGRNGRWVPDLAAIPVGYGTALIGMLLLMVAGPADLLWHERYGFEVGIEAVYSPPHLTLFFAGILVTTTGIRSTWAKPQLVLTYKESVPVVLSLILFLGMGSIVTMYLSAFMTNVSMTSDFMADLERFNDDFHNQQQGLNAGLTHYGDDAWPYYYYSGGHGVAAIVVTTVVLLGPVLQMLRRWRLPMGVFTVAFGGFGLLVNIMTEYRDIVLIVPLLVTGLAIDLLQRPLGSPRDDGRLSLGGIRALGPAAAAVLWISYFIVVALDKGIGWPPTMWVGALMVGVMTGFGVAFLIAPPSYGPRLVEGDG
jgi:hypothetical protein